MARQGHIGLLSSGGDQINVNHESIKMKLAKLLLLLPGYYFIIKSLHISTRKCYIKPQSVLTPYLSDHCDCKTGVCSSVYLKGVWKLIL